MFARPAAWGDRREDGSHFRLRVVIDEYAREGLVIEVAARLRLNR